MKLAKLLVLCLAAVFCCNLHADEDRYVFIGQTGGGASAKTVFFLEVSAEDVNQAYIIGENGEIYLKADKIVAIPKADLASTANFCDPKLADITSDYTLYECPNGHPSRHGDGRCNQKGCPYFRGK